MTSGAPGLVWGQASHFYQAGSALGVQRYKLVCHLQMNVITAQELVRKGSGPQRQDCAHVAQMGTLRICSISGAVPESVTEGA